jgi:hypothetical protein
MVAKKKTVLVPLEKGSLLFSDENKLSARHQITDTQNNITIEEH